MKGIANLLNIFFGGIVLAGIGRLVRKSYFQLIGNPQQKTESFLGDVIDSEIFINKLVGGLTIIITLLLLLFLTGSL